MSCLQLGQRWGWGRDTDTLRLGSQHSSEPGGAGLRPLLQLTHSRLHLCDPRRSSCKQKVGRFVCGAKGTSLSLCFGYTGGLMALCLPPPTQNPTVAVQGWTGSYRKVLWAPKFIFERLSSKGMDGVWRLCRWKIMTP